MWLAKALRRLRAGSGAAHAIRMTSSAVRTWRCSAGSPSTHALLRTARTSGKCEARYNPTRRHFGKAIVEG